VLACCASAQAVTSRFDTGAEGWTAIGDIAQPLNWVSSGGNPGGHVSISDAAIGGVTYFLAPPQFLGNQSGATRLTFDLMQVYAGAANQTNVRDVILTGGGKSISYDTPFNPPNGSWGSYAVPLAPGGWLINGTSVPATAQDITTVLSNLAVLQIRAEYRSGPDVGHLDNVSLVPEPSGALLLLGGLAAVAGLRMRGRC
jgi:hypothetical protein